MNIRIFYNQLVDALSRRSSVPQEEQDVSIGARNCEKLNLEIGSNYAIWLRPSKEGVNNLGASYKMTDLIGVIEEINHQVNLLAVNAAVEVARAGEVSKKDKINVDELQTLAHQSMNMVCLANDLMQKMKKNVQANCSMVQQINLSVEDMKRQLLTSLKVIGAATPPTTDSLLLLRRSIDIDSVNNTEKALKTLSTSVGEMASYLGEK